ncbi:MAG: serine protein kinase PrkA [Deltaproteobacteria bacterium]|nr:serine protein kinase PrkA [Deltaproteobacteria bacterium]
MSTDLTLKMRSAIVGAAERLAASHRPLSFDEYLALFAANPSLHSRDAAPWLRDMFVHYGRYEVSHPTGKSQRFALFDLPWESQDAQVGALVGHEDVQAEVFRVISAFAEQGRVDRLVLLHGPNGSAKSTFCSVMMRAMEHYSQQDAGARYRFSWVFPKGRGSAEGRIGFGARPEDGPKAGESYAHLDDSAIDAKVLCELRDHPLLLLPIEARREVLLAALGDGAHVPDYLWKGGLSHKSQQIFEALLSAYRGDLSRVLSHVQIERWFVSRRYRVGAVTIGPQMAVDARERQVTASRAMGALPASLQNVALFEPFGELVDAAGGVLEFSDLLKRPLDAWKYLLLLIETGEVALSASNLSPNLVMLGSANELHLDAFREHPEFQSFRGRLELVRVGYLLDWQAEARIYWQQVAPSVRRHVAPHAIDTAALFAVLTRMKRPTSDRLSKELAALAAELTPLEKAEIYASGRIPSRLDGEQAKTLRAGTPALMSEGQAHAIYEGRVGASPREIRSLLLESSQSSGYRCLSPLAVLDDLQQLITRKSEYEWLRVEPQAGGYHDSLGFLQVLRKRLVSQFEQDLREATGLIDEARYVESFERYVLHVRAFVKGEKILNPVTGRDEGADEAMMREIERALGATGTPAQFRGDLISMVAGWAIDHPGERVDYLGLFPRYLDRLREAFFAERRERVVSLSQELLVFLSGGADSLDAEARARSERALARLCDRNGYCEHCARDAVSTVLHETERS